MTARCARSPRAAHSAQQRRQSPRGPPRRRRHRADAEPGEEEGGRFPQLAIAGKPHGRAHEPPRLMERVIAEVDDGVGRGVARERRQDQRRRIVGVQVQGVDERGGLREQNDDAHHPNEGDEPDKLPPGRTRRRSLDELISRDRLMARGCRRHGQQPYSSSTSDLQAEKPVVGVRQPLRRRAGGVPLEDV